MKILWMSDSPTSPSGFGNVSRFVCAGLAQRGHQVSILGWQAHGSPEPWNGCTLYPVRHDGFGADVLLIYLQRLQPDILVTLADVWWLTFIANPIIAGFMRTAGIPWALYYPIDGDMGQGRLPSSWVHILQTVDLPIAMSEYGREVSRANGLIPAYIPHGVDTSVFCPPADRRAAKRAIGYDGKFVILSDARNQPRKLIPRTLEIFRRFAEEKRDVLLHLHCDPDDPAAQTVEYYYDLRADIEFLGLCDKVRLTTGMSVATGLTLEKLAAIYQASDVHLLSSWGEGFGLPTLQAAAAGVVPMASDYTASRELVLGHGEPIRVQRFVADHFGLRRALIDIDDAAGCLERLYRDRRLLASKSTAAQHFAEAYDWRQVVPQWHALLENKVPPLRQRVRQTVSGRRVAVSQNQPTPFGAARSSASREWPPPLRPRVPAPADGGRADIAQVMRAALPQLGSSAQVTINFVESKAGQLAVEVWRDAQGPGDSLCIPVTLPPPDSIVKARVSGRAHIAGESDVPAVLALGRIFPGLNVWAGAPVDLAELRSKDSTHPSTVPVGSAEYRIELASSTLAFDLGGVDPELPAQAAELGVPCIGQAQQPAQKWLWPELTLECCDPDEAATLGRRMLTDQGKAAELCARARERLELAQPEKT